MARKKGRRTLYLIIALALLAVLTVLALALDREGAVERSGSSDHAATLISYNGEEAALRSYLTVYLIIGTDKYSEEVKDWAAYYNYEMADFQLLAFADRKNGTVQFLPLNRDTMCDVPWLSVDGKVGGTDYEQLAYDHSYGFGGEDSCENAVRTVENLCFGLPIDHYIKFTMDSIAAINDAVGGVTVTIEEDMTGTDPAFAAGATLTLSGEQAESFVRARRSVGDGLNSSRMLRQEQYLNAYIEKAKQLASQDEDFITDSIISLGDSIRSDMTVEGLSEFASALSEYEISSLGSPNGEYSYSEKTGYMEFYVDTGDLWSKIKTAACRG